MDLIKQAVAAASNPAHSKWVCPLLWSADALLCFVIVWRIPYTEIDWRAYMQQVAIYVSGERDYVKISGDTGPLVYPAAHVYVYRLLYAVTDEGRDIVRAQYIFVNLYLVTLGLVMQCYRHARVPPYVFPMLILSKRLHSIFMLRLFNDGPAVLLLFLAILCYQSRQWTLGSLFFSLGLGTKMSLFLALPAVGATLWQGTGKDRAIGQATFIGQLQVLLGYPFLAGNFKSYLSRAFEFTRQFMFKWTVNWRFVGEDVFLSKTFSTALLAIHAALLAVFMSTRWLKPSGDSIPSIVLQLLGYKASPTPQQHVAISRRVTSDFILTVTLTSVILGCLCARSLHYQFYAYIAWSTPFLLWRSRVPIIVQYFIWGMQEWAWNVYPSSSLSSAIVVGCLGFQVVAIWAGTWNPSAGGQARPEQGKDE
ncbi:glycosyltransferase family 58 protein [Polychaeton citri CBS 116435]|uniref:Dol-P-Man:Man(5)GlcNAc(2)-PP-Dol alpha-1,3-mannosyltransferase n=1 Tax=Polychaeton citri CBS 116435 TaxID=1314669 RepID=A0A9P4QFJ5_9PEZI|nr:glycosyltransferase family 58 protein [Polychaeton citri CBS 116435]